MELTPLASPADAPSAPSPEEARPIEPDRLRAFVESVARCDCERGYQHGGWAADSCLGLEADVRQNPGRYGDPLKTQLLTGVNRCRTCEAKLVLTASVDSRVVSPSAGAPEPHEPDLASPSKARATIDACQIKGHFTVVPLYRAPSAGARMNEQEAERLITVLTNMTGQVTIEQQKGSAPSFSEYCDARAALKRALVGEPSTDTESRP